jgi:hypothetical protein
VWTEGDYAEFVLRVRNDGEGRAATLRLRLLVYLSRTLPTQQITVLANGQPSGEWTLTRQDRDQNGQVNLSLPLSDEAMRRGRMTIGIKIAHPRDPALEPELADPRRLGVGLIALSLM